MTLLFQQVEVFCFLFVPKKTWILREYEQAFFHVKSKKCGLYFARAHPQQRNCTLARKYDRLKDLQPLVCFANQKAQEKNMKNNRL